MFVSFVSLVYLEVPRKIVPNFTSGAKGTVQTREVPRSCRFVSFGDG